MSNTIAGLNSCAAAESARTSARNARRITASFEAFAMVRPPGFGRPMIPHAGGSTWLRLRSTLGDDASAHLHGQPAGLLRSRPPPLPRPAGSLPAPPPLRG